MRIAVTGASGFIGNSLSYHLHNQGYDVVALVRSTEKAQSLEATGFGTRICDITDPASLDAAFQDVDVVMHLAALFNRPEASWDEYRRVNIEGTKNVLEASLRCNVGRVIYCSTVGVATGNGSLPLSEDTPYSPPLWDKYETTKCNAEKLALDFHRKTKLPLVVIRPAQVYGPGDRGKAKFYRMVKRGIIVNPGKTLKHLIFIDDLCRAFELTIESNKAIGEIYIIAGKEAITLKKLITIAAQELKVPAPKIILPAAPITWMCTITEGLCNMAKVKPILFRRSMDFFTKSVEFDVSKAKKQLGFESQVAVQDGVSATIAWYQKMGLV